MAEDECVGARAPRSREQKKKKNNTSSLWLFFFLFCFCTALAVLCFTVDSLHEKRDFCLKPGD